MRRAIPQLSAADVARRLGEDGEGTLLLDVREADELVIARFPKALWIPLALLPARFEELPRDRDIVACCHHGIRSLHAAAWLLEAGFERVSNLAGGIDAWSLEVDPGVPRY